MWHADLLALTHTVQGGIAKAWDHAEDQADVSLKAVMEDDYPADSPYKKVHDW